MTLDLAQQSRQCYFVFVLQLIHQFNNVIERQWHVLYHLIDYYAIFDTTNKKLLAKTRRKKKAGRTIRNQSDQ
jgi:hypothetical protein